MVWEVLHFIRRGEFMPKQTKPRAFFVLESKINVERIRYVDLKVNGVHASTFLKNIELFSGFEFLHIHRSSAYNCAVGSRARRQGLRRVKR